MTEQPVRMVISVTGSRLGLSKAQSLWLAGFLLNPSAVTEIHHGDCIGVDAMVDGVASKKGIRRVVHPPLDPKYRAWCCGEETLPEKEYLDRNKDIVDACRILLVFPSGPEKLRSGTWSTFRYAKVQGKRWYIIYPDGKRSSYERA